MSSKYQTELFLIVVLTPVLQISMKKEQVAMMIAKTLRVELNPKYLDATDALAIALCHHYQLSSPLASAVGKGDWKKFLEAHPERVKK